MLIDRLLKKLICNVTGYLQIEMKTLAPQQKTVAVSTATVPDNASLVEYVHTESPVATTPVSDEPPKKRQKTSCLFGSYKRATSNTTVNFEAQLSKYLTVINDPSFIADDTVNIMVASEYTCLRPLFCRILSVSANSAPVERVFSQSELVIRPHRAKMSDKLLEALVYLKCN